MILTVDDDEAVLSVLKTGLEKDGHWIQCENDPQHIAIKDAGRIDLIILDIMMPGIDGIELVSRIRQATDNPIFFLSAKTRVQGYSGGVKYGRRRLPHLTKPFDTNELCAAYKLASAAKNVIMPCG
ncbi:response regulator transcription factor [Bifidobacterium indicum]|uniref:response regulator transcription factor n=1 Tax=Bifidobacterium indicum TaxID=1691 RepID=UPI0030DB1912